MNTQKNTVLNLIAKVLVSFGLLFLCAGRSIATGENSLAAVEEFAKISNAAKRSSALFTEMGKVILHPRCVNCHPKGPNPSRGMDMKPHEPPVVRGAGGFGAPGMQCFTCHRKSNTEVIAQADGLKSIPGNPKWHLAPVEMAWAGKSLRAICEQIKDTKRNGGKTMKELHHHMAEDPLVGWGWQPGAGREPVPGTQKQFGELFKAWLESGAVCPE